MFSPDTPTSELMQGCFLGDEGAIAEFYRRFKNLIYAAIHSWTRKYLGMFPASEDVKEVFHEALVAIMVDNFAKIQLARDKNKVSGLVFIVAFQAAGRYFKKKGAESDRFVDIDDLADTAVDSVIDQLGSRERIEIVGEFLQLLAADTREVMRLRYEEDKSYEEIAAMTGNTVSNVGVIISRVKKRLSLFLRVRYGDEDDI